MTKHSEKALNTMLLMGTNPNQWRLVTDFLVSVEPRMVQVEVWCPVCNGTKNIPVPGWDKPWPPPRDPTTRFGNCTNCAKWNKKWGISIPTGKVLEWQEKKVTVHRPNWLPGTRFDSRFGSGMNCGLCNKCILKSNMVPVYAVSSNGNHGMWVGGDCAKKFVDSSYRKCEDVFMEVGND